MFRKFVAVALVCLLSLAFVTSACAAFTTTTCDRCHETVKHNISCSGEFKTNTFYIQHEVRTGVCNYYKTYYKNKLTCSACGNVTIANDAGHLEAEIHEVCGGMPRCPF